MRSGRWQARFTVPLGHPCGRGGETITARHTFEPTTYGKEAAGDWIRDEERRLNAEGAAWATLDEHAVAERIRAEREAVVTFAEFSATWLRTRRTKNGPLQESTRRGYRIWLDKYLLPTLGDLPLDEITPTVVLRWYEDALPHDKPKTTRECYALGSAIMRTATAADGVLAGAVNPFKIDGAGSFGARSRARTEVIDEHDLLVITSTIRPEWRAMVALALRLRAAVRRDHCAPPVRYRPQGDTACRSGHPRRRNRPRRAPIREGSQDHGGNTGSAHTRRRRRRSHRTPAVVRHGPRRPPLPRPRWRLAVRDEVSQGFRRLARCSRGCGAPDQLPRPASDRRHPDGPAGRACRRSQGVPRGQLDPSGRALRESDAEPDG